MDSLAKLLKEKRAAMKLSLRSAAELIGISHTYLNKLEKGFDTRTGISNKPTPDTLKLISDTYNINYITLLEICGYIATQNDGNLKYQSADMKELISISEKFTKPQIRNLILYAKFLEQNKAMVD